MTYHIHVQPEGSNHKFAYTVTADSEDVAKNVAGNRFREFHNAKIEKIVVIKVR